MIVNSYGFLLGCGDWSVAKNRLDLLIGQAEATGLTGTAAYAQAKQYQNNNSGLSGPVVLIGSACTAEVKEINRIITLMVQTISSSGQDPVVDAPNVDTPDADILPDDISTTVKWIVGGAVAISAAILAIEVIPMIRAGKKASK